MSCPLDYLICLAWGCFLSCWFGARVGFSVISRLVRNEVKKCPKEISAFSFTGNCS